MSGSELVIPGQKWNPMLKWEHSNSSDSVPTQWTCPITASLVLTPYLSGWFSKIYTPTETKHDRIAGGIFYGRNICVYVANGNCNANARAHNKAWREEIFADFLSNVSYYEEHIKKYYISLLSSENASWRHTTLAFWVSQYFRALHTLPHTPWAQNSSLPVELVTPPTRRTAPCLHPSLSVEWIRLLTTSI